MLHGTELLNWEKQLHIKKSVVQDKKEKYLIKIFFFLLSIHFYERNVCLFMYLLTFIHLFCDVTVLGNSLIGEQIEQVDPSYVNVA